MPMLRFESARTVCRGLLFLSFFLQFTLIVSGQEYSYTRYDSKEGLAGSTVYCAQQDKEGFLWFGTETGLSRFDGTHFKNFTLADGLPDNEILDLFVDSKNRIWISPFKNSICYYWKGKIHNQQNDPILKKVSISSAVLGVKEDKEGTILIQDETTTTLIYPNGYIRKITNYQHKPFSAIGIGLNRYGSFRLAFSLQEGLVLTDLDRGGRHLPVQRNIRGFSSHRTSFILSPKFDILKKLDSLVVFPAWSQEVITLKLPYDYMSSSLVSDSLLTINTSSGSQFYNLATRKYEGTFLSGHKVSGVFMDSEQNLWFLTLGEGVIRLGSRSFRNVRLQHNNTGLSVFSLGKAGSGVYIGTDKSFLWYYVPLSHELRSRKVGNRLEGGRVVSLLSDEAGTLFIGTDNSIYRLGDQKPVFDDVAVKSMASYKSGLLVAAAQGVFSVGKNSYEQLASFRSTFAFPDGDNLYVGTLNGLYKTDDRHRLAKFSANYPALGSRITAIAKTQEGIIWVATSGEGVIGLKDNHVIANIRETNGLASNFCRSLFADGTVLWVGTDKGLSKVSHSSNQQYQTTTYTTADGLISNIINAVLVSRDTIYVGTPHGITFFDENAVTQKSISHLRLTSIRTKQHTWAYDTTGFRLENNDNSIRFEFVGLSYRSAGDITYQYKLIGLDKEWHQTKETALSYPSLPSGAYELQLVAINKFGVKSELKKIPFWIEKRFFEKAWVQVGVGLLFLGILFGFIRFYSRQIRKKEKEKSITLQTMAELEQRALRAQMNPHFIFNSLNSIQQYVMERDILGANFFITNFSHLIRQTLDLTSRQEISLQEEIAYITTYLDLEKQRMEDKFTYAINIDGAVVPQEFQIPPMILQPFVENSIRHGIGYRKDKQGMIRIDIFCDRDNLICRIDDNGVGRDVANRFKNNAFSKYKPKGMSVTTERISLLNRFQHRNIAVVITDKMDNLNGAAGTQVTITFKM